MSLGRRTPTRRTGPIKPRKPWDRLKAWVTRKPLPARNAKRQAKNFARCYHSVERVQFVKSLDCAAKHDPTGCEGPMDNAHYETDGMGRKAPYTTIFPACRKHHRQYDQHRGIFAGGSQRYDMQWAAAETERLWSGWQTRTETEESQ